MPLEQPARVARELAEHGFNADREAVTLIASAPDPALALARAVDAADPETLRLTADDVREALDRADASGGDDATPRGTADATPRGTADATARPDLAADESTPADDEPTPADESTPADDEPTPTPDARGASNARDEPADEDPSVSTPRPADDSVSSDEPVPDETGDWSGRDPDPSKRSLRIDNDVTGESTGTGEYEQFVRVFRDRYERLADQLRGRVNHRPATAIAEMSPGSDAAMIGLVNDVRSTASGHWLVELEDTTGTFPFLVMKDRDIAGLVDELLLDECVAIRGTLADDAGIAFADSVHFPDVPRTHRPSTADRHVQAALVSDVHVGSQEFMADAWHRFADWLHTEEAEAVEYLLIAGDMVEGVGVYPDQDEELDIVDIYEQYERFSEHLKEVPGDLDVVMIPGNHDAVRLAEPQPGFDDELREIMSAHDARISGNPSVVTLEGVSVLMYHGVSIDEVIAELPEEKASYEKPHRAMYQLLKKRHVAPQFGGHTRLAPEETDYLVIDDVPDVFHTGHVHKLGWGKYHNVLAVNSGCWQEQTAFQRSVNIDPDAGYAPILDLDTLDLTVRKFA